MLVVLGIQSFRYETKDFTASKVVVWEDRSIGRQNTGLLQL